ncbi:hypothetical protein yc1106_07454 [Curvularia clavata]|uniref:Uncharacterized protein n=1 Tax=Curvularia clavata TaxID=95742 RepID=A0A9Q8ZEC6_CURCL|nr:hypothetical protein yc1106_07454 [Curvularia clavata]
MATTSHPAPSFDITAADDMELYSDNGGLEYNDNDIDLDLEPPFDGQDDDVSIDDAVSANGIEVQADDNDDYMVDQEDVIEEDYSYHDADVDVDVDTVAEQSVVAGTIPTEAQVEVQDEDLLDYSEEDDEFHNPAPSAPATWLQQHTALQEEPEQPQDASAPQDELVHTQDAPIEQDKAYEVQDNTIQQDEIPADLQAPMSMNTTKNSQSPQSHTDVVADDGLNNENHKDSPRPQSAGSTGGDDQANDDDGGVLLKSPEEHASIESGHNDVSNPSHDHNESAQDSEHQEDASLQLPPVTANYMGEELWLFKQHDYEDSGDWLLEDASVAKTSMSDLFQACRSALGNEVLNGMEIGFRFDHFQNMELFEDSTASVAISLERLVGYYHVLYAQDGNNNPDSFYITIMYRPRFATLLADIARYADNGRGYSGFEAAVAAGETNFHSASRGLPVEETTKWDTERQEPEHEHDQRHLDDNEHEHEPEPEHESDASEQAHEEDANETKYEEDVNEKYEEDPGEEQNAEDQVPQATDVEIRAEDQLESEQQEQTYDEAQAYENHESESHYDEADDTQNAHEEGGIDIYENQGVAAEDASGEAHEEHNNEEQLLSSYEVSANAQEVAHEPKQIRSQSESKTAAELEARRLQQEGDIIDYSDGEDEDSATVEEVEQAPRAESSPSFSTVQGDESGHVEKQASVEVSQSNAQQTNVEDGTDSFDATEGRYTDEEQDSDPNGDAEYWAFIEATEEREAAEERSSFDESQSHEVGEDGAALEHQGDADQDYGVYEYQDLEHEAEGELEFANEEEFNGGEDGTTDGDDFTGANDILNVDDAQWAVNPELGPDGEEETTATNEVDHIDIQDDEDGVAGHIASATSSAADPTTASSTEANEVSPQGHKRSIDEVGHGPDVAPDSIGIWGPCQSRKRNASADLFVADAKRARV